MTPVKSRLRARPSLLGEASRSELLAAVLSGLLLAIVAWSPTLLQYPSTGGGDGQYYQHMLDSGKVSLLRYHELPLWNPYQCGGLPLWDNPQSLVASPLALLLTPLSATKTVIVWYVLHAAVGFFGTWCLARLDIGLTRISSLGVAALHAFGVSHACQYGGGHTVFAPFVFAPLCLYLWRCAEWRRSYAVALGALFALMFYNGAVYPVPFVSLVLMCETLTRAWPFARLRAIVVAGGIVSLVFIGLAAARLFPVIDQLAHHKRALDPESDFVSLATLRAMYLDRNHAWHPAGQTYVWPEYSAYLGLLGVALAVVGLVQVRRSELWLVAVAAVTFSVMLGHFARWSPWSILKGHVFPFESMRVPTRFRLIESAFLAIFVGIAIDRSPSNLAKLLRRPHARRQLRIVLLCLGLIAVGDVFGTASSVVAAKFDGPKESPVAAAERLYVDSESAFFLDQPRQNRGRLACWDEWYFTSGAPLWLGDHPQARPVDPDVKVLAIRRTQNSFVLDVEVQRDGAEVLLNGAWDRGWRTTSGRIFARNKQIVLALPPGSHHVRVHYWPVGLTLGLVVSATTVLVVVAALWWKRASARRRRVGFSWARPVRAGVPGAS